MLLKKNTKSKLNLPKNSSSSGLNVSFILQLINQFSFTSVMKKDNTKLLTWKLWNALNLVIKKQYTIENLEEIKDKEKRTH